MGVPGASWPFKMAARILAATRADNTGFTRIGLISPTWIQDPNIAYNSSAVKKVNFLLDFVKSSVQNAGCFWILDPK